MNDINSSWPVSCSSFRYEREEEFFALNLTVKSHNLESSLEQFVRGEMLEGDNAYLCEKCEEKVRDKN